MITEEETTNGLLSCFIIILDELLVKWILLLQQG